MSQFVLCYCIMPAESVTLLQKILKAKGYSLTLPRKIICELLWGQEPLTMHELNEQLRGRIDRASLYRTISLFEQLGLVQRIYIGWKYKIELSDIFTHHHHHISCVGCGKVVAITEEDEIEALIGSLAKRHGFSAASHQLEVRGYCAVCGQPSVTIAPHLQTQIAPLGRVHSSKRKQYEGSTPTGLSENKGQAF